MSRKKKILIIGGSGFIGFHLAKKCLKKSWSVTSISRKLPKKKRYLNRVNYILCDISLKKEISKKIDGNFDYVVNLGGEVDHSKNNKTYKSHFIGVNNISNFFINKKISKFLQIEVVQNICLSHHKKKIFMYASLDIWKVKAFSNPAFAQFTQ